MIKVTAVQPESIAEELGLRAGHRAAVGQRPRAGGLPRLGVPHRRRGVPAPRPPARTARRSSSRSSARSASRSASRSSRPDPPLRQPLRLLLRRRPPRRAARRALHPRRRLPALLPLRQLRHAHQPQAAGRRADHRVPALAALRLGARHRPGGAPLAAPQPDRARHPRAAAALRRARHRVPHPDRDVARRQRRRGARQSLADLYDLGPADPGLLGGAGRADRVQQAPPGARADRPRNAAPRSCWSSERAAIALRGARRSTGCSAPTSCTCAPESSCRRPRSTASSTRWRTASARCAGFSGGSARSVTAICGAGPGRRIGVVTGTAMGR